MEIVIHHPRPKGRPRKIIPSTEKDKVEESDNYQSDDKSDKKIAKLKYKHDNIENVRLQQCVRYAKIKGELAVKRLMHTIMSDKYSNDQRKQVLEQLKIKIENNDNQELTAD